MARSFLLSEDRDLELSTVDREVEMERFGAFMVRGVRRRPGHLQRCRNGSGDQARP